MLINTDYLVVGAGASGLAFADALVAEADVEVTLIDRQARSGRSLAACVSVRPPAYSLGVLRRQLAAARRGPHRPDRRERRVLRTGDGRARSAGTSPRRPRGSRRPGGSACSPATSTSGQGATVSSVRDLSTGELHDVAVRRKVVDARYLEASIPATHTRPFDVAPGARVVPVNDLPAAAESASSYAVLGSGKTAVGRVHLAADNGVAPDRIRWVRPRDAWFYDRAHFQPLEQVGAIMEGISLDAEAGAQAANIDDLFERLEASGRLVRIDPSRPATMYRGTMLSAPELRGPAADRRCGQARPGAPDRARPDRPRARGVPNRSRRPARGLHGARPQQRPRHADLPARPDRAPAGAAPLAVVQRSPHRLRRGPPGQRRGQEPALPTQPLPQQHRRLAAHDEPHLEDGATLVERARPLGVGGRRAGSTCCVRFPITSPSRPCRRRSSAISPTSGPRSSGSRNWTDRARPLTPKFTQLDGSPALDAEVQRACWPRIVCAGRLTAGRMLSFTRGAARCFREADGRHGASRLAVSKRSIDQGHERPTLSHLRDPSGSRRSERRSARR